MNKTWIFVFFVLILLSVVAPCAGESDQYRLFDIAPQIAFDYLVQYYQIDDAVLSNYLSVDNTDIGIYEGCYRDHNGRYIEVNFYHSCEGCPDYTFTVVFDLESMEPFKVTRREVFDQMIIQETTGDYSNWWNHKLVEYEQGWGDVEWWSYEQRYTFQHDSYGWGAPRSFLSFALPAEDQIQYDEAYEIMQNVYDLEYGVCLEDNDRIEIVEAFIDYEYSTYDYIVPRRLLLNSLIDRWIFIVVDTVSNEELLWLEIDAFSGEIHIFNDEPRSIDQYDYEMYCFLVYSTEYTQCKRLMW